MKPTVSDKNLRDAVEKELDSDPEVVAKHISVTAIDGAIMLGGHVMSIHEKHVAVRAAERCTGRQLGEHLWLTRPGALGLPLPRSRSPGPLSLDAKCVQASIARHICSTVPPVRSSVPSTYSSGAPNEATRIPRACRRAAARLEQRA